MRSGKKLALKYIRTKFKVLSSLSKTRAAAKAFELFCTPQYRNTKKLPRIFETAEQLIFQFNNNQIHGYRWNKEADKKLLILHGYESTIINFDRYIKPLVQKGYCVLAFDAPAHGRSSGKTINALLYSQFIDYINIHYGPVKNYIAHSLGGLALSLALERSEHNETFKVVFIAPATETTTAANSLFQILKLDNRVRLEFDKIIEKKGGHPPEWFSVSRAAKNIKANVLWFQDKEDEMTPFSDVTPIIERNYRNFEFVITNGLGHRRIYRDSKVNKMIIDFF
jgi:pimeloyl-ACP methyl ester carboxylesterase